MFYFNIFLCVTVSFTQYPWTGILLTISYSVPLKMKCPFVPLFFVILEHTIPLFLQISKI
jgi:hypothetical protein